MRCFSEPTALPPAPGNACDEVCFPDSCDYIETSSQIMRTIRLQTMQTIRLPPCPYSGFQDDWEAGASRSKLSQICIAVTCCHASLRRIRSASLSRGDRRKPSSPMPPACDTLSWLLLQKRHGLYQGDDEERGSRARRQGHLAVISSHDNSLCTSVSLSVSMILSPVQTKSYEECSWNKKKGNGSTKRKVQIA